MNDQNQVITPASEEQTLKRKRGRPRRDESISRGSSVVEVQELGGVQVNDEDPNGVMEDEFLGQVVSGVLSGSFDAGYFVTVKPHNCDTILTGLVFCPGKVVPVTLENDLAPQQKMYIRKEYDVSPINQLEKQQTPKSVGQALDNNLGNNKFEKKLDTNNDASKGYELSHQGFEFGMGNFYTPVEDYRIVDQEEIMKEFEASACMTAPSSASKQTDYNSESLPKLQSDYLGNSMASQNVDHCLKLKEPVQVTIAIPNDPDCSGLIPPSNFCPSEAAASLSLKYTPLMGTTTSTQQITDAAADQGKYFDVNERPSIDDIITESQTESEPIMMLFGSTKPVHSDLKLGFAEELSSSTYEKKNPNKLPFFLNLTDISADTPKLDEVDSSSGATKKPATDNLSFTIEDSQTTRMTTDQTTQETVSSELKLSATATPQPSYPILQVRQDDQI
ncbi:unnamed protein product [Rhodiola kirilowii]